MRPLVVENAREEPPFAGLAVTRDVNIGSYIGVPLVFSTGEVFGTLCAIDPDPHRFSAQDTQLLILLARLLAFQIEQDRLQKTLAQQYQTAAEAEAAASAILHAARDSMILVSSDGRFLAVNRSFETLFGVSAEQVLERTFAEIEPEFERAFADAQGLRRRLVTRGADPLHHFSEIVQQRWPAERELALVSTSVCGPDGSHLGHLYAFRDVTREREVDRMKSEFVSQVAHELRTPLTSIKGFVDLVLEGDAGEVTEDQTEFLGIVRSNVDRLVDLINDLLDVSRIESGRTEFKRDVIDIRELLEEAVRLLRPQTDGRQQEVILTIALDLPPVLGDPDRLTQVVVNLLSNACKFTLPGGRIDLRARVKDDRAVWIEVADTGVGMTPEEQSKLFTKFYRARNRAADEAGGTGLGLAIARSLVESHGGRMTVRSAPGEGSTFAFSLPAAEAAEPGEG